SNERRSIGETAEDLVPTMLLLLSRALAATFIAPLHVVVRFQQSHPIASSTLRNVEIRGPLANSAFPEEGGFDIRSATRRAGCAIQRTRPVRPMPTTGDFRAVPIRWTRLRASRRFCATGSRRRRFRRLGGCSCQH